MKKILVAGIGNLFLGDDGFGPEVARRLITQALPDGVEAVDAGIGALHLAHRMLDGYDLLIAVDAATRGGAPGTLYLIEAELDGDPAIADGHALDLPSLIGTVRALGGTPPRVLVLGCEPADLGPRIGLSAAVEGAVPAALERIWKLLREEEGGADDVASAE